MASIIKANELQDFGGNSIITSDGAGTVTVNAAAMKNTPAFEAQLNGNQTVSNDTSTKLEFDTETFDTDGAYDSTTNYRFTPQTPGKYYVYCKVEHYGGTTNSLTAAYLQIKKNGSTEINSEFSAYPDAILHKIFIYNAGIIEMNGSSDYVEAFIQGEGSNSTQEVKWNAKTTLFGAYKIIGA